METMLQSERAKGGGLYDVGVVEDDAARPSYRDLCGRASAKAICPGEMGHAGVTSETSLESNGALDASGGWSVRASRVGFEEAAGATCGAEPTAAGGGTAASAGVAKAAQGAEDA